MSYCLLEYIFFFNLNKVQNYFNYFHINIKGLHKNWACFVNVMLKSKLTKQNICFYLFILLGDSESKSEE